MMKKSRLVLLLALVGIVIGGCYQRFPYKYSETARLSVPLAAAGTLSISTQNGSIRVASGDVEDVRITAEKTVRSKTEEEARQFCEETRVETESGASGASVFVVLPEGHRGRASIAVSIEAVVPMRCNLELTTSNGRVEARKIEGNVEMNTSNGAVEGEDIRGNAVAGTSNGSVLLERISGSAGAVTSNGRVTVRDVAGDIRCQTSNGAILLHNVVAAAEAVTSNGSIMCYLPGDASATVSGRTSNGKVSSDFPLTIRHNRLSGKIGEGKHPVELSTTNGKIRLRRMK
jgi:DUF4097 and DUF4098 domain-containing protein YvlB